MRNKKQELNDILSKYDSAVQKVYQKVLSQEKNIKNIRKAQMKSLIDKEIMEQVQKMIINSIEMSYFSGFIKAPK